MKARAERRRGNCLFSRPPLNPQPRAQLLSHSSWLCIGLPNPIAPQATQTRERAGSAMRCFVCAAGGKALCDWQGACRITNTQKLSMREVSVFKRNASFEEQVSETMDLFRTSYEIIVTEQKICLL